MKRWAASKFEDQRSLSKLGDASTRVHGSADTPRDGDPLARVNWYSTNEGVWVKVVVLKRKLRPATVDERAQFLLQVLCDKLGGL